VIHIGTSGWQYRDWRGVLYPEGCPQRSWLAEYAQHFATVENNNAFYRLPEQATFEKWREATPSGFVMAVKASRYLTHVKRLREPAEPVDRLLRRASGLGDRLGPVLLQLPPTLRADQKLLGDTLGEFPDRIRVAVEFRHASWWTEDTRRTLEKHAAACVWADRGSRRLTPLWRTADWGYLRLHEGRAQPHPAYGRGALTSWWRRLRQEFSAADDVYVYFNNDPGGAAVRNAREFTALAPKPAR
jgi:uncharacterized protein YecE (DUF72 family)